MEISVGDETETRKWLILGMRNKKYDNKKTRKKKAEDEENKKYRKRWNTRWNWRRRIDLIIYVKK